MAYVPPEIAELTDEQWMAAYRCHKGSRRQKLIEASLVKEHYELLKFRELLRVTYSMTDWAIFPTEPPPS